MEQGASASTLTTSGGQHEVVSLSCLHPRCLPPSSLLLSSPFLALYLPFLSLSISPSSPTTQSSDRLSLTGHSLQSVVSLCRHCCRCHRALLRWWHATCAAAAARTKQTIRFYCFLVCEKLRGEEKEKEELLLLQVAAGCCLLLHCVAESNKPKSGKAALVCFPPPAPSSSLHPLPIPPLCSAPLGGEHCKQGRCTSCQNEQLLCKNVAQLTCSMPPLFSALLPTPSTISALSSRLSCCHSSRCATCPRNVAYAIWKLIA